MAETFYAEAAVARLAFRFEESVKHFHRLNLAIYVFKSSDIVGRSKARHGECTRHLGRNLFV